jgi:hypothetical protein
MDVIITTEYIIIKWFNTSVNLDYTTSSKWTRISNYSFIELDQKLVFLSKLNTLKSPSLYSRPYSTRV